jgi:hypothetical protein
MSGMNRTPPPQNERRIKDIARPDQPERRKKVLAAQALSEWETEGGRIAKRLLSNPGSLIPTKR